MYDETGIDPADADVPPLTPEGMVRFLSDFERDTIQRNREALAASGFIEGWRRADDIAPALYWPQDTREREESRALELDILEANHRDFMRRGRD